MGRGFTRSPGRGARMSLASLALAATLSAGTARAADDEGFISNTFEITPFAGYMAGGKFEDPLDSSDRDIESDTNYGLIFNAAADYWRHYEILYVQQSTSVEGAEPLDLDVQYLQIGGTVSHPDARRFIPYFGITVGAVQFSPDAASLDDETKLAFSVGTGFKVPITDHIGVRFDARGFFTLLDTDGDLFCVSSGGAATCRIRASGDTLFQYAASLGVTVAF